MPITVSLCVPYYEDPHRLYAFLHNEWLSCFDEVIIVDDASTDFPALPIVENCISDGFIVGTNKISVYRIQEDYGFNAHGARNLAAQLAKNEWLFFHDIDMIMDEDFIQELTDKVSRPEGEFVVCRVFGGDPGNIFAVRKEDFFDAGGYDEELRGYHMGDKLFRARLEKICKPVLMDADLPCDRMGRSVRVDDQITGTMYPDDKTVVQRSQKHVQDILDMINKRNDTPQEWKNIPRIQFDWTREI